MPGSLPESSICCTAFLNYNRAMRVTVGVSGGIAAYKAAELVRALQRQAVEVHVVMTEAAQQIRAAAHLCRAHRPQGDYQPVGRVGTAPATQRAEQNGIDHIAEAQWADALVVAPATANILAKFAHGIADDFLTTMYLATTAPVLVAPAMNVNMWNHPATQANLETLRQRGVRVIEPGTGDLACGMVGAGRMAEPEAIADGGVEGAGPAARSGRRSGAGDGGRHARGAGPGAVSGQSFERQDGLRAGRGRAEAAAQR